VSISLTVPEILIFKALTGLSKMGGALASAAIARKRLVARETRSAGVCRARRAESNGLCPVSIALSVVELKFFKYSAHSKLMVNNRFMTAKKESLFPRPPNVRSTRGLRPRIGNRNRHSITVTKFSISNPQIFGGQKLEFYTFGGSLLRSFSDRKHPAARLWISSI
jgi:hypothetical protein